MNVEHIWFQKYHQCKITTFSRGPWRRKECREKSLDVPRKGSLEELPGKKSGRISGKIPEGNPRKIPEIFRDILREIFESMLEKIISGGILGENRKGLRGNCGRNQ